jgi:hypothetical protein
MPPVAAILPQDANANAGAFYNDLSPYGAWVQQPDYGLVWQPTVETINPGWTPYVDAGQWLYSDCGWYWQSDYTWGWAVYHYGRWANVPHQGWIWQPGNIWSPAWVAWRSSSSYIGWAPLPPGAGLNVLGQLTYNSKPVAATSTLGLPASAYTFVHLGSLTSHNLPRRAEPATRIKTLVEPSVLMDSYSIVNNRIFNGGASREAVAAARGKAVPQVTLRSVSAPETAGLAMDRKTLAVYVPSANSPAGQSAATTAGTQAAGEKSQGQETSMIAENNSAEAAALPVAPNDGDVSVQLPPLHYPSSASPPLAHSRHRVTNLAPSRGFPATTVEHPSTPAPRLDEFNPPVRQAESPRFAVENRAAPVQPAHAAPPAPAPVSSSAGSSKSGK